MTYTHRAVIPVVTRRTVLGFGGALSVAGSAASFGNPRWSLLPREPDASRTKRPIDSRLYAFRPRGTDKLVLAVTAPSNRGRRYATPLRRETRFHIGAQSLAVPTGHAMISAETRSHDGVRTFSGPIVMHVGTVPLVLQAALLELPLDGFKFENMWAEQLTYDDRRQRVASPFLAVLLAEDAALAPAYHAGSPETDSVELQAPVASTIARMAKEWGYPGDARAYSERIARAILPDVTSYDPRLPQGFTFAARNGRHPDDADLAVAHSVMTGTAAAGKLVSRTASLQPFFPYFQPAA